MRARGLEASPPELTAGLRLERRLGRDVLGCADHPCVLETAVVSLPDPVYGERVKACLVARPGARLEVEDSALGSRASRYRRSWRSSTCFRGTRMGR